MEQPAPHPLPLEPVPDGHDGLLGPNSVAWKVLGHPAALIGGLRALIVQSLHPLAMAGVAEHSDYRRRPLDRLRRTAHYVGATAMGDTATALGAAERVRRVHSRVRGIDPVTGAPYSADDPDTQVWVHIVEWHSFLVAYRTYGRSLSRDEQDRCLAEGVPIATLVGTPPDRVPASLDQVRAYYASVRPQLRYSELARDAIQLVLDPPFTRELLPMQVPLRVLGQAALAIVPRDLRRLAKIDRPRAADALAIAAVRPLMTAAGRPPLRNIQEAVLGPEVRQVNRRARRVRAQRG